MHRIRKLFIVSLACTGIVMVLLLAAVLTAHMLANREMVKSIIIAKTAQATGGTLAYDRLDISFLPLPHLKVRYPHLRRSDAFDATAQELSIYPRILSLLKGQISIHRLALVSPDVKVFMGLDPKHAPNAKVEKEGRFLEARVRTTIGSIFSALPAIDPGSDLQIEGGTVTLAFTDAPDFRIIGIQAAVGNNDGDLSLNLQCRSDLTGRLDLRADADIQSLQASGKISLTDLNIRPLLIHAALPGGIISEDTQAAVNVNFTVDGPESVNGRFDLQFPSLTALRKDLKLTLDTVAASGEFGFADKGLSVSIDTLTSAQPALDLSAAAGITPTGDAGRSVFEVRASAGELDVAVAGAATRAIAGDLAGVRTAFSVAREGQLTHATYFAGFDINATGWHLKKMQAAGHLSRGLVTIPGIAADLERMEGDVIYEDRHVAFKNVSGHFKGAAFQELDAAIAWEKKPTLWISSPSVTVDAAPMYAWLTAFEGLSGARSYVASVNGNGRLSGLRISGPLHEPQNWALEISGTPEDIRLTSPLVPFAVRLWDGEIIYAPGNERAADVNIEFLDSALVTSYQSRGIINPESVALRVDGSMGPAAIEWLSTLLPFPEHLQMKPPVDLFDVNIAWSNAQTFTFMGGMKTAGGVDLFADFTVSPQEWYFRRIQFADGSSQATAAARKHTDGMEVRFSGNVEKETADRLLENNQTLSGRLDGDFHALIDARSPLKSSFSGKLAGEGLHIPGLIPKPIHVRQFSITGSGDRLEIASSKVSLGNSLLLVDGTLGNQDGPLTFDLNVDADRLDEELIRALKPVGTDKTGAATAVAPRGILHLKTADFTYGGFTWSPVLADIRVDGSTAEVEVHQAILCGISTTGELNFSPRGIGLQIRPSATGASLQKTTACLWQRPVNTQAQYDLSGEIHLPPTQANPTQFLSGQMEFSSDKGRIEYAGTLMKIFSVLNVTEVFTGGKSDLTENGYGYTKAYAKAEIGGGKLQLSEILLDGISLKITGQGSIDLGNSTADIILLAAPLKTIDRIVNNIPVINYIAGGSLISIPLHATGPLTDIQVTPMSPAAVGRGVLNLMERTLKAPFKLVQGTAEFVEKESSLPVLPPAGSSSAGH
ncbi:AsmA-like C-terminal domain-containing protein [Desulfosarcina sp.]|uniref:AsmA-like C-terminal domain-containing protein n=1 Tax=Desulfosarcina sp. TaxID=2027861 RepID=UPI003970C190